MCQFFTVLGGGGARGEKTARGGSIAYAGTWLVGCLLGVEGLVGVGAGHRQRELLWQRHGGDEVRDGGHEDGGDDELDLEAGLDLRDDAGGLQVGGDEGGGDAHQDAGSAAGGEMDAGRQTSATR